jgi:hypothetical protein
MRGLDVAAKPLLAEGAVLRAAEPTECCNIYDFYI